MKNIFIKVVSVAMIACLGFGIASCGKKEKGLTINEGKLIMATNATFPPYEFYDGGEIVGIDAEIAAEVASRLGLELEIQDVAFDSIIAGVQSGKYDIGCAGMTDTPERRQSVNFTISYATGIQSIIVPEGSEISDLDSLLNGDYIVGVQQGTTGDSLISLDPEDGGVGEDRVERYNNGADAVLALQNGNVDAVVIDDQPAQAFVAANEGLMILETPFADESYAMAINKDNEELLNEINRVLEEMKADGTLDAIIEKYIPSEG